MYRNLQKANIHIIFLNLILFIHILDVTINMDEREESDMNYVGNNQPEIRKSSTSESTIYNKTRGNSNSSFSEALRALEAIKHVREHPLLIEKIQEVEANE